MEIISLLLGVRRLFAFMGNAMSINPAETTCIGNSLFLGSTVFWNLRRGYCCLGNKLVLLLNSSSY